jgi:hypothetical protein
VPVGRLVSDTYELAGKSKILHCWGLAFTMRKISCPSARSLRPYSPILTTLRRGAKYLDGAVSSLRNSRQSDSGKSALCSQFHHHNRFLGWNAFRAPTPAADSLIVELPNANIQRGIYMKNKEIDVTKKKGGKSRIVKDVIAKGFTARKAEKAVNAVINSWRLALWYSEPVEIPGGTIQSKLRRGRPHTKFRKFRNINTGKTDFAYISCPGRRRVVKFKPDLALDLTPLPPLPLPETAEQVEARQLASYLLGKAADKVVMAALQKAAELHRCMPGSLLLRLREYKDRGWYFVNDHYGLERHLAAWFWL